MRRNATCLIVSGIIPLTLAGCNTGDKSSAASEPTVSMVDSYSMPMEETTYEPEPQTSTTYGSPAVVESDYNTPISTSSEPRYHTVVKKDTLYRLARTYYGDHRRWRDIYEANRSIISDPNRIRIGQRLLIP